MLRLENITKKYGDFTAVADIHLELEQGVYGLLSPNGAGKTTLLKMIATLMTPTSGEIIYDGKTIQELGEHYRELLGYLPQHFGYYRDYTAVRYLSYLAALKGMDRKTAASCIEELLDMVGLADVKRKKLKTYSGGMLQRVGIAQAMLTNPKILILDEPTAGLDPRERARFRELLAEFARDRLVLYSTHIVSDIENIANRIIMLKEHQLYCNSTVEELCQTLEGKVYSAYMEEAAYKEFAKEHFVLSVKPERNRVAVRFVVEEEPESIGEIAGKDSKAVGCMQEQYARDWRLECPNLEDVFLYIYREE